VTKPTVSSAAGLEIGNTSGDRDQIYCRLLVGDELDVGIDYRFPAPRFRALEYHCTDLRHELYDSLVCRQVPESLIKTKIYNFGRSIRCNSVWTDLRFMRYSGV
jgi:hypothetical protein